jgi:predicted PurR-regulated permease PerM
MKNINPNNSVYDITIRMVLLFIIVAWCLMIMLPFVHIILWGIILALAFMPLHSSLSKRLSGKPKLASSIIVLVSLAIIIIPGILFMDSIIEGVKELRSAYQAGTLTIPPPSEKVKSWPVIGDKIYDIWSSGTSDLKNIVIKYKEQLAGVGSKVAKGILGATSGMLQLMGAIIIAGVLLVVGGTGEEIRKFFRKVAGNKGDEFADVAKVTVGNVVKGVLGVALIQSLLIGIGFLLAGIPFAGLWTLIVFIFAVLQLPPALVVLPIIVYMFSEMDTLPAVLWTIYLFLAGLSDNILKPILLGKGAPVPMLVIFIGVIGGFIFSGFIGLFTGAIVMSIGYKLLIAWINSVDQEMT